MTFTIIYGLIVVFCAHGTNNETHKAKGKREERSTATCQSLNNVYQAKRSFMMHVTAVASIYS